MTISQPIDGSAAVRSWTSAARRLIPTPEPYRRPDVGRAAALRLLDCDEATLDLLLSAGLPATGTGRDLWFDRYDLINVAVHGGTGRSVPEAAQRFLLRYADGPRDGWTAPRSWTLRWMLACADPGCTGTWRIRTPVPELFGGRLEAQDARQTAPGVIEATGGRVRLTAGLVTGGFRAEVRSSLARKLFDELLDELETERLRYQWLPPGLNTDAAAAVRHGAVDCVAAALVLAERARDCGLNARTRRGRMLGMLAVDHSWAEVQDTGGRWLPLDPIFALLGGAGRVGAAGAEFREFCAGSVPSRFLPWDRAAGEPLAEHECAAGGWTEGTGTETFLATPAT
ncbi:transglutaminase domain-containing protein [Actinocorallia longicatena]|uniref:Transglutaminase-like domain-containing protein n=1 Tax=Actinocorallia longicatena TaxID=111803 RepID=A0ABP6Q7F8_9ACTN